MGGSEWRGEQREGRGKDTILTVEERKDEEKESREGGRKEIMVEKMR